MSEEPQLDIQDILRHFRELNALQAQEIAVLKATVDSLTNKNKELNGTDK